MTVVCIFVYMQMKNTLWARHVHPSIRILLIHRTDLKLNLGPGWSGPEGRTVIISSQNTSSTVSFLMFSFYILKTKCALVHNNPSMPSRDLF